MAKNINIHKALRIILFIPLALIALIILVVLGFSVANPIMDRVDRDKFSTLDTQMTTVYNQLKTTSNGTDKWKYLTVCTANLTGDFPTGSYNCVVSISTQKTITSVQELNNLQAKYYPIIDSTSVLSAKTVLDPQMADDFGKKFVVSTAEKRYAEKKTGVECQYLIGLYPREEDENDTNFGYGVDINKIGRSIVSFRCDETARKSWYSEVSSTSNLIPDSY